VRSRCSDVPSVVSLAGAARRAASQTAKMRSKATTRVLCARTSSMPSAHGQRRLSHNAVRVTVVRVNI
jgi:hypothetical protein